MDLFTSNEAKRALHSADTQIRDICLNFQAVDPTVPDLKAAFSNDMLSAGRLRPVKPAGMMGSM